MFHKPKHFWERGDKWRPKWLVQSPTKYNAVHPNDQPDPEYINANPLLCFAKPTPNGAMTFLDKINLEAESPNEESHNAAEQVSANQDEYVSQSPLMEWLWGPQHLLMILILLVPFKIGTKSVTNFEITCLILVILCICLKYCFMLIQVQI